MAPMYPDGYKLFETSEKENNPSKQNNTSNLICNGYDKHPI